MAQLNEPTEIVFCLACETSTPQTHDRNIRDITTDACLRWQDDAEKYAIDARKLMASGDSVMAIVAQDYAAYAHEQMRTRLERLIGINAEQKPPCYLQD